MQQNASIGTHTYNTPRTSRHGALENRQGNLPFASKSLAAEIADYGVSAA